MASPDKRPKISIHSPQSEQERDRVYGFRYRTLVERQGGSSVHADHEKKVIKDDLDDSAFHLFLMAKGGVVASVRVNSAALSQFPEKLVKQFQFDKFSEFGSGALSMTSRLFMAGGSMQSKMAAVLMGAAYKIVRNKGNRFDFASCPPSMVGLYEMLGYRRMAPTSRTRMASIRFRCAS